MSPSTPRAPPRPNQGSHRAQAPRRVLVVDDEAAVRIGLEALFAAYGYETSLAKDGQEALALLRAGIPIDFIVLDLMMPRMTGFEFLRQKRELPELLRSIPVAVCSATHAPFLAGVVLVLPKPTPPLELLAVVNRYTSAKGQSTAS